MNTRHRLHIDNTFASPPPSPTSIIARTSRLKVPGLGASYTFFHFLRANLSITDEDAIMSSVNSSPALRPAADDSDITKIAKVDLSKTDVQVPDVPNPLEGIPSLTTYHATSGDDQIDALKLVADSVAQMRQTASRTLLYHPATIAAYGLVCGFVAQYLWKERSDIPVFATTCIGILMAFLVAIKGYTGPYIDRAEKINWDWLENEQGQADEFIVTKFGEEIIGTVLIRLVGSPSTNGKSKKGSNAKKDGKDAKGLIRGWAVRLRYRGKGVGSDLLDEAIKFVKEKLGSNATIEFADDHANSHRFMPHYFNYHLDKDEKKGRAALAKALERSSAKK